MRRHLSSILAMGLITTFAVSSFEIHEGCKVQDSLKVENILFETLEFLSIVPRDGRQLKVTLNYGDVDTDLIRINSSDISLRRKRGGDAKFLSLPSPAAISGWTRFTLGLNGSLTLHDQFNNSWLPPDVFFDRLPESVSIHGDNLTLQCPSETPFWVVEGNNSVEIPLHEENGHFREDLKLFGLQKFSPQFTICDARFQLGRRDGRLVTSTTPLDGHAVRFSLLVRPKNILELESEGTIVFSSHLKDVPTHMRVQGRPQERFVVVQHLPTRPEIVLKGNTQDSVEKGFDRMGYLPWILTGFLSVSTIVLSAALIFQCRQKRGSCPNIPGRGSNSKLQPETPYLQPRPTSPHTQQRTPLQSTPTSSQSESDTEHIYEEHDVFGVELRTYMNVPVEAYANND